LLALAGAAAYATLAFRRSEPVNSAYILIAAVCTYVIGYRFYDLFPARNSLTAERAARQSYGASFCSAGFSRRRNIR